MTNVPAGWYAVVPSVTAGYYQYILANGTSSDSVTITNTRGNYNVSFSAIARATVPGQFTFNTININLPADNTSTLITIYRECLNIFGTGWVYKSFIYPGIQDSKSFDFGYRGSLATTITNNLRCDCSANGQIQFTFYVRQPLTNCPDSTTWQIDWTALTATKIN